MYLHHCRCQVMIGTTVLARVGAGATARVSGGVGAMRWLSSSWRLDGQTALVTGGSKGEGDELEGERGVRWSDVRVRGMGRECGGGAGVLI
jgi:hypothetical protein